MKASRLFPMTLAVLAAFTLAACTGTPVQLQSAEVDTNEQGETELEFTGAVDSIGSNAWSIGGLVVGVTASTQIQGDPAVGDLVKVHALVVNETTLVAREIERSAGALGPPSTPVATHSAGEEIEFFGSVVTIASDTWTVGDRSVAIISDTEIKGTISVGDPVKVHATVQPDLSLTAREIEPATEADLIGGDDDRDNEDLELKGPVESIAVESIAGDIWTVAGVSFVVPPGTPIDGAVQVGDTVEIHAVWSADGVLTAVRIHLEDGPGDDDSFGDDSDDDNSGSGSGDDSDDDDDDNSGHGGGDDDNSGSDGDDDNSGSGG